MFLSNSFTVVDMGCSPSSDKASRHAMNLALAATFQPLRSLAVFCNRRKRRIRGIQEGCLFRGIEARPPDANAFPPAVALRQERTGTIGRSASAVSRRLQRSTSLKLHHIRPQKPDKVPWNRARNRLSSANTRIPDDTITIDGAEQRSQRGVRWRCCGHNSSMTGVWPGLVWR